MKKISILGSTGSIGESSLKVIDSLGGKFRVLALTGRGNLGVLTKQVDKYAPKYACLADEKASAWLSDYVKAKGIRTKVLSGGSCLEDIAGLREADTVIMAIVGFVGLKPLLRAVKLGKRIALANKEVLVAAGGFVMKAARKSGAEIFPVDSEHSAIFQCLRKENSKAVRNIILTASGGAFYGRKRDDLHSVTVEEAVTHPNWKMGKKITVDSATLMNKGLEAIEAHHLFGVPMDKIKILIHPQSIIHSMVEFVDGSVIAQLSKPDMTLPIRYSLTYPDRIANDSFSLDLEKIGRLDFFRPQIEHFPCLGLALEAAKKGGAYPVVLNAANEVAVQRFISGGIKFLDIPGVIESVLSKVDGRGASSLDDIFSLDEWARQQAEEVVQKLPRH